MRPFYIKLLSIILIFCLGVLVYSNTFFCSFHFDDVIYIINNFLIKNIQHLLNIWGACPCRFITFFSIAFNHHFNGLNVFGYHLFNLAVHLGAAILVWWLTLLTLSTPAMKEEKIARHANLIALFAGLIFVSHPIQTEAVTYIWQRAASMAAFFYLASLCFYVKSGLLQDAESSSVKRSNAIDVSSVIASEAKQSFKEQQILLRLPRRLRLLAMTFYISALITAIMAMFTKENAITLPLMIVFYEFSFFKTKKNLSWPSYRTLVVTRKHLIPFLLTLFIIPVTMLLTKSDRFQEIQSVVKGPEGISPIHYLLTQFRVMVTYIRLIFLPLNQNLDYDYPIFKNIFEIPVLTSFLFLMGILFCAKRLFLKYRLISFSIFWFFLTLLPESSFLPQNDVILEHRLYLPLVGFCIFLVSSVYYLWGPHRPHAGHSREVAGHSSLFGKNTIKTMIIVLTIIIACYSVLTYQRNKVWKDDITLWNDTVQKSPHKARAYNNLGLIYDKQGNFSQALSDYNKAIEIAPHLAMAYNNRGSTYAKQGNFTLGLSDFNKAIEIDPGSAGAYNNRGDAYYGQGNFTQAMSDYNKAIEINPGYAEAYYNRGSVHAKQGNLILGLSDFNKAIEINPDYANAYYNRGSIDTEQGDYTRAIFDFNKALELNPKDAEAYYKRGILYKKQGDFTRALSDYNKAIEINPDYGEAYNNRGDIYCRQGNFTQALPDFNKAIEINPEFAGAFYNRGLVYAKQGNFILAVSNYSKAIELNPQFVAGYNYRAISYYQLKEYDKAWADVRKVEEFGMHVNPELVNALRQASGKDK